MLLSYFYVFLMLFKSRLSRHTQTSVDLVNDNPVDISIDKIVLYNKKKSATASLSFEEAKTNRSKLC